MFWQTTLTSFLHATYWGQLCLPVEETRDYIVAKNPYTHHQQHGRDCDALHADTVSNFSLMCWVVGRYATLPMAMQPAATGQASKLSTCYVHISTPSLTCGRLRHGSTCTYMYLCAIAIHQNQSNALTWRRSLSHDIIAMCGWRSIAISAYRYNP